MEIEFSLCESLFSALVFSPCLCPDCTEGQTTGLVMWGLTLAQFFSNLNWEHHLWPACHAVKINTLSSWGKAPWSLATCPLNTVDTQFSVVSVSSKRVMFSRFQQYFHSCLVWRPVCSYWGMVQKWNKSQTLFSTAFFFSLPPPSFHTSCLFFPWPYLFASLCSVVLFLCACPLATMQSPTLLLSLPTSRLNAYLFYLVFLQLWLSAPFPSILPPKRFGVLETAGQTYKK